MCVGRRRPPGRPEARRDAAELATKVSVSAGDPYATSYPASWGAAVSVILADGTKLDSAKPECKGDPESALNDDEMIAKARDLIRFGGINDPAPVIDGIMGMSQGGISLDLSSLLASAA